MDARPLARQPHCCILLSSEGWKRHTGSLQATKCPHSELGPTFKGQAHTPAINSEVHSTRFQVAWLHYRGRDGATGTPLSAQPHAQIHSFQFSHLDGCNKNDKPSSTLHISSVALLFSAVVTLPYST